MASRGFDPIGDGAYPTCLGDGAMELPSGDRASPHISRILQVRDMNRKTKGKAQPKGKMLPTDAPLVATRPALLADFELVDGSGIQAKAIVELRTAMGLAQDLQSSASRDELKINTILAHLTNTAILAAGTPKGRIWLENICARRGQSRRADTSLLLLKSKLLACDELAGTG